MNSSQSHGCTVPLLRSGHPAQPASAIFHQYLSNGPPGDPGESFCSAQQHSAGFRNPVPGSNSDRLVGNEPNHPTASKSVRHDPIENKPDSWKKLAENDLLRTLVSSRLTSMNEQTCDIRENSFSQVKNGTSQTMTRTQISKLNA